MGMCGCKKYMSYYPAVLPKLSTWLGHDNQFYSWSLSQDVVSPFPSPNPIVRALRPCHAATPGHVYAQGKHRRHSHTHTAKLSSVFISAGMLSPAKYAKLAFPNVNLSFLHEIEIRCEST